MENIPMGYRFQPSDYELLMFLFRFVIGRSVHDERLIHHEDIFGEKEPWELFRSGSERIRYSFTQLKRKSKKSTEGLRFERTVGKMINGKRYGNWHGQDKGKPVFDKEGKALLGYKRSFVYKNKNEQDQDGQWLLKEFHLSNAVVKKAMDKYPILEKMKDFVLCRLQRKKRADHDQETSRFEDVPIEITLQLLEDDSIVPTTLPPTTSGDENGGLEKIFPEQAASLQEEDADDISSYFDGVTVEIVPEQISSQPPMPENFFDEMDTYLGGVSFQPVPMEDNNSGRQCTDLLEPIWSAEDLSSLINFDA